MKVQLTLRDWQESVKNAGSSVIRYALILETDELIASTCYVVAFDTYYDYRKSNDIKSGIIEQHKGYLSTINSYETAHLDEYIATLI